MTPDEFNESARAWIILALRDHPKLGASVTFTEGWEFANNVALNMTSIYRNATTREQRST